MTVRERYIGVEEFKTNLSRCLDEVGNGTTLVVTDGRRRLARVIPEAGVVESKDEPPIARSGRRLTKTVPRARLRGGGTMADIVRENRR